MTRFGDSRWSRFCELCKFPISLYQEPFTGVNEHQRVSAVPKRPGTEKQTVASGQGWMTTASIHGKMCRGVTLFSVQKELHPDLFPRGLKGVESPHSKKRTAEDLIERGAAKNIHARNCNKNTWRDARR